jgi:hypothetical protein
MNHNYYCLTTPSGRSLRPRDDLLEEVQRIRWRPIPAKVRNQIDSSASPEDPQSCFGIAVPGRVALSFVGFGRVVHLRPHIKREGVRRTISGYANLRACGCARPNLTHQESANDRPVAGSLSSGYKGWVCAGCRLLTIKYPHDGEKGVVSLRVDQRRHSTSRRLIPKELFQVAIGGCTS